MKRLVSCLLFVATMVFLSCQQEPDVVLQPQDTDTTMRISPMFRVVESHGTDSFTRIFKRVIKNGERSVVVAEVFSEEPLDTLFTVFIYDIQNHLVQIKNSHTSYPGVTGTTHQFTWNGNRLLRMEVDTGSIFAKSYDFFYSPDAANTVVTSVKTPSDDVVTPDYISKTRHIITVDSRFIPLREQWIDYSYFSSGNADPGLPQMVHDTLNAVFNFSGDDLMGTTFYFSRHDTNARSSPFTNIYRDTTIFNYSRSAASTNIADSLKSIFGKEVYTMMNFDLLYFYYLTWMIGPVEYEKFYFSRPLASLRSSRRSWVNGFFDATESYNDLLEKKTDNTFDANGRLVRSVVYQTGSETLVYFTAKIYYE